MAAPSKRIQKNLALLLLVVVLGWIAWALYDTYSMVRAAPTDPKWQKQAIIELRSKLENGEFVIGDEDPFVIDKPRFFEQRVVSDSSTYSICAYVYGDESLTIYLHNDAVFAVQELRDAPFHGDVWYFCDPEKMAEYIQLAIRDRDQTE